MSTPPRVVIGERWVFYRGPSHEPERHRHFAVQIVVGLEHPLRVEIDAGAPFATRAALVPSERPHRISSEGEIALLLVEPASLSGMDVRCAGTDRIRTSDAPDPAALSACAQPLPGVFDPQAAVAAMLDVFMLEARDSVARDARIRRLQAAIASDPRIDLVTAAEEVGLSSGRLRHLFREQTGLAFSRYLLWERIKRAVRLAADRPTLTDAAIEAGFSDSAHFSNRFRALFGIAPSIVLRPGGILAMAVAAGEAHDVGRMR